MTKVELLIAIVVAGIASLPSQASDWGYEKDAPVALPAPAAKHTAKPAAAQKPAPLTVEQKREQAVDGWLWLYALASEGEITEDRRKEYRQYLKDQLSKPDNPMLGVLEFRPVVQSRIDGNSIEEENFRYFLRALLRLQMRSLPAEDPGRSVLSELLGPLRIAVPGDPPLTEDAINAYSDMACFIYEQKNPGRTMDAVDNRTVFAHVIAEKFKEAPSAKDKLAMVNFDINWAKFKLRWTAADAKARLALIKQWGPDSVPQAISTPADKLIELVVQGGPWSNQLISRTRFQANLQPGAGKPNGAGPRSK